jgi:chemotaxis protein histidine kinase CheA
MSDDQIHLLNWYNEFGQYDYGMGRNARLKAAYEKMLKEAEQKEAELQKELTNATMPTMDDIRRYAELVRSGEPILSENMKGIENFLRELGLMKDTASDKSLSALQQGIQSVSEETAGALEAYMNSVSQQVYLHSDLLTQIRDIMVGWNFDVQLGALSQILLQLQSSYQVQMSIQNILIGWSNPSGGAVKVELIS